MNRELLMERAKDTLSKEKNIAISAATGTGKSKVALKLAEGKGKVLIFVAETAHKENWRKEMVKWGYNPKEYVLECYASMRKYQKTSWGVVIFDEAHHLGSDLRMEYFSTIFSKYRIFLSATLKDSFLFSLSQFCGHIGTVKMGLQEAFDKNVLPEPKIVLLPLKLDNTNYSETIVIERGEEKRKRDVQCMFSERWSYIKDKKRYPDMRLKIACTQRQKYLWLTEQAEWFKNKYMANRSEGLKNRWLQCGSQRKRFLGFLKTSEAMRLTHYLSTKGIRFICFCSSIEQASLMGESKAIHSKKQRNSTVIQRFNSGKIDSLYAVGMLQEGQNLENIQAGVIIQLDGEERPFIQKFGRVLRAYSPTQYILYYEGTRDEEYLSKALENINNDYIIKSSVNEICDRRRGLPKA